MNLAESLTYSSHKFLRFHEKFSHVIKTNAIGLTLLQKEIEKDISENEIADMITKGHWRNLWGGMPAWNDPKKLIAEAIHGLGGDGVARVFSAFDVFLSDIEGEISAWRSFDNQVHKSILEKPFENEEFDRLWKFLDREKIVLDNLDVIKPIYNYYRLCRNSIVHRNGSASPSLAEASNTNELKKSVKKWKCLNDHKTLLPIQNMLVNEKIQFTHQHAIFASDLLYRIAIMTNRSVITNVLGSSGMIYLVAKRNILNGLPDPNDQLGRNCYSYISWKLKNVFRVSSFEQSLIIKILKEELKIAKDCYKKYEAIREQELKNRLSTK